jgi:Ca2+-binding EF-hand superfamily protein
MITELASIIQKNKLDIKKIFNNFDKSKDGTLDLDEFSNLIKVID